MNKAIGKLEQWKHWNPIVSNNHCKTKAYQKMIDPEQYCSVVFDHRHRLSTDIVLCATGDRYFFPNTRPTVVNITILALNFHGNLRLSNSVKFVCACVCVVTASL